MTDKWYDNYKQKMERMGFTSYDKYVRHCMNEKFRTKENLDTMDLKKLFTKSELAEIILELFKKPKYVTNYSLNDIMLGYTNVFKERKKRLLKLRTDKVKRGK
tara:strand:+ start:339 stop:647 length:309 start_codon:yes stop_codon:yes gene_type:complete